MGVLNARVHVCTWTHHVILWNEFWLPKKTFSLGEFQDFMTFALANGILGLHQKNLPCLDSSKNLTIAHLIYDG